MGVFSGSAAPVGYITLIKKRLFITLHHDWLARIDGKHVYMLVANPSVNVGMDVPS